MNDNTNVCSPSPGGKKLDIKVWLCRAPFKGSKREVSISSSVPGGFRRSLAVAAHLQYLYLTFHSFLPFLIWALY